MAALVRGAPPPAAGGGPWEHLHSGELVAALVRAEREHRGSAEVAWENFYTGILLGELGSSSAPD